MEVCDLWLTDLWLHYTCHSCSNIILLDILRLEWSALQVSSRFPKMLMIHHTMSTQTLFVASGRDNLMTRITGSFTTV